MIVVTGSASGIGAAVADLFLQAGDTVLGLDAAAAQPAPDGAGEWLPATVDVSDAGAVRTALDSARERGKVVDTLVVSAAVGFPDPFEQITEETWDRVMAVNVRGTIVSIQAVLPDMLERGRGSIVVVSSIAGRRASVTNGAHYTCSKYAQVGLVRHLTQELAGTGVRINCVCPGPTATPALDRNSTPEERDQIAARTPLRRIGQARDVAEAVAFLAGDHARHISGAVLDVNGGLY